jgi:hypothetical protein
MRGGAGQGEGRLRRAGIAVTGLVDCCDGGHGYSSGPPGSARCGSAYPDAFWPPRVCS